MSRFLAIISVIGFVITVTTFSGYPTISHLFSLKQGDYEAFEVRTVDPNAIQIVILSGTKKIQEFELDKPVTSPSGDNFEMLRVYYGGPAETKPAIALYSVSRPDEEVRLGRMTHCREVEHVKIKYNSIVAICRNRTGIKSPFPNGTSVFYTVRIIDFANWSSDRFEFQIQGCLKKNRRKLVYIKNSILSKLSGDLFIDILMNCHTAVGPHMLTAVIPGAQYNFLWPLHVYKYRRSCLQFNRDQFGDVDTVIATKKSHPELCSPASEDSII